MRTKRAAAPLYILYPLLTLASACSLAREPDADMTAPPGNAARHAGHPERSRVTPYAGIPALPPGEGEGDGGTGSRRDEYRTPSANVSYGPPDRRGE